MVDKSILKFVRSLKHKKHRVKEKKIILEGKRLVLEALNTNYLIESIFISKNHLTIHNTLLLKAKEKNITIYKISEKELLSISNTINPQSIFALGPKPKYNKITNKKNILYLDQISDPGNLGTLIRTAEWFGIKDILLSTNSVDPFNPKVIRSGMGAHFHLNSIEYCKNFNNLIKQNYFVLGADLNGETINNINFINKKWILVIGSEAHGISLNIQQNINKKVKIKGYGNIESLNASVAGGILLNELTKKY